MLMLPAFPIELEFIDLILSYAVQFTTLFLYWTPCEKVKTIKRPDTMFILLELNR